MDLNDSQKIGEIDSQGMYTHLESLPDQLLTAWQMGKQVSFPAMHIEQVIISGMGGSAIGADLVTSYISTICPVPVIVNRDYGLPAWAKGKKTLVILSSHSGNTEETLSSYKQARANGCNITSITTGGELAKQAALDGLPIFRFKHDGQPRSAVGFSFGLLLSIFYHLGFIPDHSEEIKNSVDLMHQMQPSLSIQSPVSHNFAKRVAMQLAGQLVTVTGSDFLAPVARRWKGQLNELAKAVAHYEVLPEMDHNTLAGILQPDGLRCKQSIVFLTAANIHSRNHLRLDLTRQGFSKEGFETEIIEAPGETPLQQIWTGILLGDYIAYYLAMCYEVDPTPIEAISQLKNAMQAV